MDCRRDWKVLSKSSEPPVGRFGESWGREVWSLGRVLEEESGGLEEESGVFL